ADAAADAVTVNGTVHDDVVQITAAGTDVVVAGLRYTITLSNPSAATDALRVNGNAGDDVLKAFPGVEKLVGLTIDGGSGDDALMGGGLLIPGPGSDTLDFSTLGSGVVVDLDS